MLESSVKRAAVQGSLLDGVAFCFTFAITRAHGPPREESAQMKDREALSLALNLSWTMLFSLLIPLLAGIWLDKQAGTSPLFVLIGAVLGILAATVGVARMALRTFSSTVGNDLERQIGTNSEEEPQ
jgi:F0F1-type ATP synthase assembly protein I